MAKLGIDISTHQGNINLAAIKDKIDFVIIRVGFGVSGTIDNKFKRNVELCKELGIPFGFYWYSYALDEMGAVKEANAFLKAIEPYKNDYSYGCWFDMEDADGYKAKNGMPSNEMLRKICAKFCEIVEGAGYYVGIYASQSWFAKQLNGEEVKPYDKWIAQWPTSNGQQKGLAVDPNSKNDRNLWQFTSMAQIEGYNGRLDANYAYLDYPGIIASMRVEEKPEENEEIDLGEPENEPVEPEHNPQELPKEEENKPEHSPQIFPEEEKEVIIHIVKRGDSLEKIARKYNTTWEKIYEDNKDTIGDNPHKIFIGQKLNIVL